MQACDVMKFTVLMAGIGELYGKVLSSTMTDIYWHALKHYEFQDVQNAFKAHVNNPDCGQYLPKPSDIVRFIEGTGETRALQAWSKVERVIREVGSYESLAFDDPLIHAVLEEMGGWIKLCSKTQEQMTFAANEFQKRYISFLLKKPERHPRYLCGITEAENGKRGFEVPVPLLVGNPEKARDVFNSGGEAPLQVQALSQAIQDVMRCLPKTNKEEDDE